MAEGIEAGSVKENAIVSNIEPIVGVNEENEFEENSPTSGVSTRKDEDTELLVGTATNDVAACGDGCKPIELEVGAEEHDLLSKVTRAGDDRDRNNWTDMSCMESDLCSDMFPDEADAETQHEGETLPASDQDSISLRPKPFTRKFKCAICNKQFYMKSLLQRHLVTAHLEKKQIECCLCHRQFKMRLPLRRHALRHSKRNPLKCSYCPKRFRLSHLVTHSGEKNFKCHFCQERLRPRQPRKKRSSLGRFPVRSSEGQFECEHCHKRFHRSDNLRQHALLMHSEERRFKRDPFQRERQRKADLCRQLRVHLDEKQFECGPCSKQFHQTTAFGKHSEEKRYQCDVCQKRFSRLQHLCKHKLVHSF